jgi:hypothetical protein
MTAKLSGTDGLLQQYDYQTPTTGFSYTFASGTNVLVMNPAGTLATGTITMPAAPADGMTITFSSTQTITALTVNANTGQSIVSAATVLPARQAGGYIYRLSNTTWYPYESVPTNVPTTPAGGSIITSGTAVASTSGTAIGFTAIPSWVKKITVMLSGVSTSGTSVVLIQLGTGSTTYTTSGYLGTGGGGLTANTLVIATQTTGFGIGGDGAATYVRHGSVILTNITGNTWVASGVGGMSDNARLWTCGGTIALAAALTAVQVTTVNGTDTFDAGTINILYE